MTGVPRIMEAPHETTVALCRSKKRSQIFFSVLTVRFRSQSEHNRPDLRSPHSAPKFERSGAQNGSDSFRRLATSAPGTG